METKPGIGYPKRWESRENWKGGWTIRNDRLELLAGGRSSKLLKIFHNPNLPSIDDYYEPWTYNYKDLIDSPSRKHQPSLRPKSLLLLLVIGVGTYNVFFGHYYVLDTVAPWIRGIVTLTPEPGLLYDVPWSYKLHILLAFTLFALSPFTRLIHIWSIPIPYLFRNYLVFRKHCAEPARTTAGRGASQADRGEEDTKDYHAYGLPRQLQGRAQLATRRQRGREHPLESDCRGIA
ncbi:hypothetical protein DSTSK_15810 [Desulforhabdus sp. TSK]|nr:respiratory nitrate reductase subunit gamma [Desulforhabdus sp. TSK]GKT08276.1 hypothetical protein DSTSK_15810 [Desulforhabdus sp. TSK]